MRVLLLLNIQVITLKMRVILGPKSDILRCLLVRSNNVVQQYVEDVKLEGKFFHNIGKSPTTMLYRENTKPGHDEPEFYGDEATMNRSTRPDRYYVDNAKLRIRDSARAWNRVVSAKQAFRDYVKMPMRSMFGRLRALGLEKRRLRGVMTMPSETPSEITKMMISALENAIIAASPYHASTVDSFSLLLITEPSAVMLHTFFRNSLSKATIPAGTISIYDLGGGTTDICSYRLKMNANTGEWEAQETAMEQGILSGGIKIDDAFFAMVEDEDLIAWTNFIIATESDEEARLDYQWRKLQQFSVRVRSK